MYCFKCGKNLPDDANFCVNCGTDQQEPKEVKICGFCGAEMEPDSTFCTECGNKLVEMLVDAVEGMDFSTTAETEAAVQEELKAAPAEAAAPAKQASGHYSAPDATAQAASTDPERAMPAQASYGQNASGYAAAAAKKVPVQVAKAAAPVAGAAAAGMVATAAAPVVSAAGTAVISGAATVATTAAVGAAKTGISAAKRVAILGLVVAFLVGGFSAWLAVFVGSPEATTEEFFEAAQALDFDSMLSCMDPGTEKQVRAILNLTGGIIGSLTGIDIDLEALASLAPGLVPFTDMDLQLSVRSVETVLYSDDSVKTLFGRVATMDQAELEQYIASQTKGDSNYMSDNAVTDFLAEYNLIIPGIAKLTAKSAIVKVVLVANGETQTVFLPLQNEGYGDWRIYLNLNLLSGLPTT